MTTIVTTIPMNQRIRFPISVIASGREVPNLVAAACRPLVQGVQVALVAFVLRLRGFHAFALPFPHVFVISRATGPWWSVRRKAAGPMRDIVADAGGEMA